MIVKKAPEKYELNKLSIFLAGSIEMGKAEDWQTKVTKKFEPYDVLILNPRRNDWNSSWKQSINDPQFNEQVTWELEAQEDCDIIVMHFCPETKSPITLLELGLFAKTGKIRVSCHEDFWRRGNVEMVCDRCIILFLLMLSEYNEIKKPNQQLKELKQELKNFKKGKNEDNRFTQSISNS